MARPRIGLALGSGAARGWAHLGVLRALEEAGIQVDLVAGTSMGALVGAVYAAGRIGLLEEAALAMDWKHVLGLLDIRLRRSGLVDGTKIEAFVREHVEALRFEDLHMPFAAVATDLYAARKVVLDHGDIIEAVRASISLPGIFTPVERDGRYLVDGGLVDPVPVSVARAMGADIVVAVDLNHSLKEKARNRAKDEVDRSTPDETAPAETSAWLARFRKALNEHAARIHPILAKEIHLRRDTRTGPTIFDTLVTSLAIMQVQITEANLRLFPPDLLIRPSLADFTFLEFNRAPEAIRVGHHAAVQALENWTP